MTEGEQAWPGAPAGAVESRGCGNGERADVAGWQQGSPGARGSSHGQVGPGLAGGWPCVFPGQATPMGLR
jgi:hypothetical protein